LIEPEHDPIEVVEGDQKDDDGNADDPDLAGLATLKSRRHAERHQRRERRIRQSLAL
jgi:hypothetical protein